MKLAILTILISIYPALGFAETLSSIDETVTTRVVHEEEWEARPEKKTSRNSQPKNKATKKQFPNADEMIEGLRMRGYCVGTKDQLDRDGVETDDVVLILKGPGGKGKMIYLKVLSSMKSTEQMELIRNQWKLDAMLAKCNTKGAI